MLKKFIITIKISFVSLLVFGQAGGQRSMEFLSIPSNAIVNGLGGVNVSLADKDVNLFLSNPALVSDSLEGSISVSYLDYFADISYANLAYAHRFDKLGTFFIGLQNLSLGEIDGFDPSGNAIGAFKSNEFAITVGHSHQVNHFRLGANLKFAGSNVAGFRASALLMDLGGVFIHPNKDFRVGMVMKNIGFILSDYTTTSGSKVPFDFQIGTSFKPAHTPFRLSFTFYNLYKGDISYFDPAGNLNATTEAPSTADKVLRHMVFGTELLLSKNVNVRFGYNHLVRRELRLTDVSGGAGFSFGFMFRVKAFEFAYSRGGYHPAGGTNSFTVTSNLNYLIKKNNNN